MLFVVGTNAATYEVVAPRILIVDDHPLTRDALAGLLQQSGFEVAGVAADGEAAIELARALDRKSVV